MWSAFIARGHRYGFTRNESVAVLILSAALAAGGILHAVDAIHGTARADFHAQYREHDSAFARLAAAPARDAATDGAAATSARSKKELLLAPGAVDINSADAHRLAMLPGIGRATAERIVRHREEAGPFRTAEDLLNVRGIGAKKFASLKPFIRVR